MPLDPSAMRPHEPVGTPRPSSLVAPVVQVWARDGARTELSPGALDMLRLLRPGRPIELVRADGRRDRWRVVAVGTAPDPIAHDVIAVDDARAELTLLVCGGAYLPEVGGYERPLLLRCEPDGGAPAEAA